MKFTLVLKWMLVIGVLAAVVVGGVGLHYWNQRETIVEAALYEEFRKLAPDLTLKLGRSRLDGMHRLTLSDIELRERDTRQPLLRAASITIDLDAESTLDQRQPVVRNIRVDGAEVLVIRGEDGRWNWQNYHWTPPKRTAAAVPRVQIRQLRVQMHLKHGEDIPSARLLLSSPLIQAVPASAHQMEIEGTVDVAGTGDVKLAGSFDTATGTWKIGGSLTDLTANRKLLDLAQHAAPRVRTEVDRLNTTVHRILPPVQVAGRDDAALLIGPNAVSAPRFEGQLNVDFDVQSSAQHSVPQFRLLVDIQDGRLSVPGVPVHLSDVNAEFFADNDNVILRIHDSAYNDARVAGRFTILNDDHNTPPEGFVQLQRFPIDNRLRSVCPPKVRELFDKFEPDLLLTGSARFVKQSNGKWGLRNVEADVTEGKILHHKFRYPLTSISAILKQRPISAAQPDVIIDVLEARGKAGEAPWTASGIWKNPGPGTESIFTVNAAEFPLDERFRAALEPKARRVIESLDLVGQATAQLKFYRPPGPNKKTRVMIRGQFTDASLQFEHFPFRIDELRGDVSFDSKSQHWKFQNLDGRHGTAVIGGQGDFQGLPEPGVLDLNIQASRLALDSDLYNALGDSHKELWSLLNPTGFADTTVKIDWTAAPGQKAVVTFPESTPTRIYDGHMRPRPFPYAMDVDEVFLSFIPNDPRYAGVQHCRIHSLKASHKGAPISASGHTQVTAEGMWRVHLDDLNAHQLPPDEDLRAALPDNWTETLSKLHPTGRVSVKDSELDFRGIANSDADVTAAWRMNLLLHNCTFNAGLDVEDVHGSVTAQGDWDGSRLQNQGDIRIDTASVLDMPLTEIHGPYQQQDAKLVLGDQEVLVSKQLAKIDPKDRVRASAYGGTVYLDAIVDSRPGRGYVLFTEIEGASLQQYAQQNIPNSGRMGGTISAWLALHGNGDTAQDVNGRGELEINPASLYENPVVVSMLSALSELNFMIRDRAAFNYARLNFDVNDERFHFNQIDLIGESLALRGRGSAGFSGDLNLDFYSRPPRPSRPSIPFLNLLTSGATQWLRVQVWGTTKEPHTKILPTGQLDKSLQQFLNAFNPQTPGGLNLPSVFPFAGTPLGLRPLPFRR